MFISNTLMPYAAVGNDDAPKKGPEGLALNKVEGRNVSTPMLPVSQNRKIVGSTGIYTSSAWGEPETDLARVLMFAVILSFGTAPATPLETNLNVGGFFAPINLGYSKFQQFGV